MALSVKRPLFQSPSVPPGFFTTPSALSGIKPGCRFKILLGKAKITSSRIICFQPARQIKSGLSFFSSGRRFSFFWQISIGRLFFRARSSPGALGFVGNYRYNLGFDFSAATPSIIACRLVPVPALDISITMFIVFYEMRKLPNTKLVQVDYCCKFDA